MRSLRPLAPPCALGALLVALACAAPARPATAGPRTIDGFESASAWTANPASGVLMRLSSDAGAHGKSLRIDFDFQGGGGYAVVHRAVDLDLPENYRFTFAVRGECGPENLEFKLIDSSGDNVWWVNTRDFVFSSKWTTVSLKQRHFSFAWGPAGGGTIRHVAAIEFAVTAGSGGKGTVWLDDLALEELPVPVEPPPAPTASASSWTAGHEPAHAVDADTSTWWESRAQSSSPWLELDLKTVREFGGLVIDWMPGLHATDYDVEAADARGRWSTLQRVRGGNGGRDALYLPESEARRLRIRVLRAASRSLVPRAVTSVNELIEPSERLGTLREGGRVAIREVTVEPLAWSATPSAYFENVAKGSPRGRYPRAFSGEQTYWAVLGVDGGRQKGLINEEGMVETGRGSFSIEPFLWADGRLVTWADVTCEPSLEEGDLPIPTVRWRGGPLDLDVTAFADGPREASMLTVRYVVRNRGLARVQGRLFLAVRPFQVNPPTQFLNLPGGVATVRTLALSSYRGVRADGGRGVVSAQRPDAFGAATLDQGDITDFLATGKVPPAGAVEDHDGRASGALSYDLDLLPGHVREVDLQVPLGDVAPQLDSLEARRSVPDFVLRQQAVARRWREVESAIPFAVPDTTLMHALRAQIAWMLIDRDGPALQPGTRSYDRTWIRDGALMCAALLRVGQAETVREFLDWFAPHQYADGKVPCCVDARGADPVPEYDSQGELIYAVAEYWRMTGDTAEVVKLWPHVRAAAAYLDTLRAQRRTPEWAAADKREFYGLLPPSISHEGYSAKPMHSYWDDLFALRGYKDAAMLARLLGRSEDAAWLGASRDTFAADLGASIRLAMEKHKIDYVPGCADLGDFDATSTTIALNPVQADSAVVPAEALKQTFQRYWGFFSERRDSAQKWDVFTPYEWRNVGAMARLGMRAEADSACDWLMGFRRPPAFQQWAEVVGKDERAPRFIGDMPHAWVSSDFMRSVFDMVAYEREADSAIVIGAGLPEQWLDGAGVSVKGLPTRWGPLTCTLRRSETVPSEFIVRVEGNGLRLPPGGVRLEPPVVVAGRPVARGTGYMQTLRRVTGCVDAAGAPVATDERGGVTVHALPAEIHWRTEELESISTP